MPNLAIELVFYMEEDNMWIGPRQVGAFIMELYKIAALLLYLV